MIKGTTMGPTTAGENSTLAIGNPVAIDFFEPHMSKAILSPRFNPRSLPPHHVAPNTMNTNTTEMTPTHTIIHPETVSHTPASVALTTETNTTAKIVPLSHRLVNRRLARTQSPNHGWATWPTMNGSRSSRRMSRMLAHPIEPEAPMSHSTNNGVAIIPIKLETVAAVMAPAILPRATDTNATEDCTVDGNNATYNRPAASVSPRNGVLNDWVINPKMGNRTNVEAMIAPCRRTFFIPSTTSRVDSLAP